MAGVVLELLLSFTITDASLAWDAAETSALEAAFKAIDVDGNGELSFNEIQGSFAAKALLQAHNHPMLDDTESRPLADFKRVKPPTASLASLFADTDHDCSSVSNLRECASRQTCFPHISNHNHSCTSAEAIACMMDATTDYEKKLLFLSDGLSNYDLIIAMRQLVLELPDESWHGTEGASAKALARTRRISELAANKFWEPELYGGLQVTVITDACFFKQFSNTSWPCEDFKPVLEKLGFTSSAVLSVSVFDDVPRNASQEMIDEQKSLKERVQKLEESTEYQFSTIYDDLKAYQYKWFFSPTAPYNGHNILKLIANSSVLAVNGGNADFVDFVLTKYIQELSNLIKERVTSGSMMYVGRSAGAMAGGADIGLSVEARPSLTDNLLQCEENGNLKNLNGLRLAQVCAIRPHYKQEAWDIAAEVYQRSKGLHVVRIPNGEGMMCSRSLCKMVGMEHDCTSDPAFPLKPPNCTEVTGKAPHSQGSSALSFKRRPCINGRLAPKPIRQWPRKGAEFVV